MATWMITLWCDFSMYWKSSQEKLACRSCLGRQCLPGVAFLVVCPGFSPTAMAIVPGIWAPPPFRSLWQWLSWLLFWEKTVQMERSSWSEPQAWVEPEPPLWNCLPLGWGSPWSLFLPPENFPSLISHWVIRCPLQISQNSGDSPLHVPCVVVLCTWSSCFLCSLRISEQEWVWGLAELNNTHKVSLWLSALRPLCSFTQDTG